MFFNSHQREDSVLLGAITNELAGLCEVRLDIVARDADLTLSSDSIRSQSLESC